MKNPRNCRELEIFKFRADELYFYRGRKQQLSRRLFDDPVTELTNNFQNNEPKNKQKHFYLTLLCFDSYQKFVLMITNYV